MAGSNSGMYGRYTGPMTDRAEYEDLLGGRSIMGGDAESEANIMDMLLGTGDQYAPGGQEVPPMFPGQGDPVRDFINQKMAALGGTGGLTGMRNPGDLESADLAGEYPIGPKVGDTYYVGDFLKELGLGRGDQYAPGGPAPMPDPQDYIRQQLAGDVVPMYGTERTTADVMDRFGQPGAYMGSRGAGAINQMGGPSSPYLDLLNILAFPSGRSMAPPMRRR